MSTLPALNSSPSQTLKYDSGDKCRIIRYEWSFTEKKKINEFLNAPFKASFRSDNFMLPIKIGNEELSFSWYAKVYPNGINNEWPRGDSVIFICLSSLPTSRLIKVNKIKFDWEYSIPKLNVRSSESNIRFALNPNKNHQIQSKYSDGSSNHLKLSLFNQFNNSNSNSNANKIGFTIKFQVVINEIDYAYIDLISSFKRKQQFKLNYSKSVNNIVDHELEGEGSGEKNNIINGINRMNVGIGVSGIRNIRPKVGGYNSHAPMLSRAQTQVTSLQPHRNGYSNNNNNNNNNYNNNNNNNNRNKYENDSKTDYSYNMSNINNNGRNTGHRLMRNGHPINSIGVNNNHNNNNNHEFKTNTSVDEKFELVYEKLDNLATKIEKLTNVFANAIKNNALSRNNNGNINSVKSNINISNVNKNLSNVSGGMKNVNEVKAFLRMLFGYNESVCKEYIELLVVKEGFDDLDILAQLTDVDLIQIGIAKKGHRMKILSQCKLFFAKRQMMNEGI